MNDQDPALQFFTDGNVDLYGTLEVDKEATEEQIKKAYKKLALKYHPDKVLSSSSHSETTTQFQKIGFSYAVLSDPIRRKKYDLTGSTAELMFGEGQEDFDWNDYFQTLWTGQVTRQTLDEFKQKYQNSEEERQDILTAYQETNGSLEAIFEQVPCCEFNTDEKRFIDILQEALDAGGIKRKKAWKTDETTRKRLREKAQSEANEAEQLAKELGVYDDLFGSGSSKKNNDNGKKGKGKGRGNGSSSETSKRKRSEAGADEQDGLDALQALIQKKNTNRMSKFDDMIARLETKGGAGSKEARPTDEEFDKIQQQLLERKQQKKPPSSKKAKK